MSFRCAASLLRVGLVSRTASFVPRTTALIVARKITIYTRTGDKGTSSLYNGERRPKTDACFEALGDVDELNSVVGVAISFLPQKEPLNNLNQQLHQIQSLLLDAGSSIATPLNTTENQAKLERAKFPANKATELEGWIDQMQNELPPLTNFILPGGGSAGAHLHQARSVCRRAERRVTGLVQSGDVEQSVLVFLNRLSDFFFAAARYATHHSGGKDDVYQKAK